MNTTTCKGYLAGGISAGIKKKAGLDLGIIFSLVPASTVGVFTKNSIKAAPVLLDQQRLPSETSRALIVNSGNANCCNGGQGMEAAISMTDAAAEVLGVPRESVLAASTGVIGVPMPTDKICSAVPALVKNLSPQGFPVLAQTIMTTDTFPKLAGVSDSIEGREFSVIGVAKGSGMIHPNMATMLCFVCTDLGLPLAMLAETLTICTNQTFNRISVDGDTSTNDTILLMANRASGIAVSSLAQQKVFQQALFQVLERLADMVVKDGEGATKKVRIMVNGAVSDSAARTIADSIAGSALVKTALFGEDANWGRVMMAIGKTDVPVQPDKIDLFFDKVQMVSHGCGCGHDAEKMASAVLKKPEFNMCIELNQGTGTAEVLTCDLSYDYVKINADYRS